MKQHVFPLTEAASWAWLPLPIIGSLYPLSRKWGISSQDLSGKHNKRMVAAFDSAFRDFPPLVYARYLLVSGAGRYGHASSTGWRDETRFAAAASGYMRLDVLTSGRVRLGVMTVDESGHGTEAFSLYLD